MRICYGLGMRISAQRHTLAVLRTMIGKTQKEMAAMLECSTPTIQAVELGRLNLSEKLAILISQRTGINLTWLLTNDVAQPPIDGEEAAYTKATFEKFRAQSGFKQDSRGGALAVHFCFLANLVRLKALLLRTLTDDQMPLCAYKLKQAFDEWETEFGVTLEDQKTVGSPLCGPAAQHLTLEKMIEAGLDHGLTGDTPFELAIEIQTRKKARRPQQRPDRYEVFSDGRLAPLLGEKGVKSPLDPKKK